MSTPQTSHMGSSSLDTVEECLNQMTRQVEAIIPNFLYHQLPHQNHQQQLYDQLQHQQQPPPSVDLPQDQYLNHQLQHQLRIHNRQMKMKEEREKLVEQLKKEIVHLRLSERSIRSSINRMEKLLEQQKRSEEFLKLYIMGDSSKSQRAIANIFRICREELSDLYTVEIIDVLEQPQLAEQDKILVTPTLVKQLPPPLQRIIGDMSNTQKVLLGLDVIPKDSHLN